MPYTLFNPNETSGNRVGFERNKKGLVTRILKAYGTIEMTIFSVLFIIIVVLVIAHNFID